MKIGMNIRSETVLFIFLVLWFFAFLVKWSFLRCSGFLFIRCSGFGLRDQLAVFSVCLVFQENWSFWQKLVYLSYFPVKVQCAKLPRHWFPFIPQSSCKKVSPSDLVTLERVTTVHPVVKTRIAFQMSQFLP